MCKCIWAFLSFIYQIPPIQFSLHFGEKTFWWARRENIWALLIFSLPSLQPNTHQKSFPSRFLSKIFHPPYFISKQTHCRYSGHAFWPLALCNFPLSHIKEFFLPPLPYKREPKRAKYHQFSQKISIHPIPSPNKHTVSTLDMLFGLWPYATFLCPTSNNSSCLLCLISVSRKERSTINYYLFSLLCYCWS